ncbi:hypothetical protein [Halomonas sp. BM-2019]|uniref:hypothetical protein n=1 Tax=Halomonas sp. BM-2019 TaxID=2811227 RepID=UPI001B3C40DB|nr:MAG: hypothetical protein J5F18_13740 [Halomonas sp. BM-2019]
MSVSILSRFEGVARARGWRRWGLSLLVVTLLLLLLEGGHRWLESRSQAPLFRVIVAGESLTLDAETHAAFSRDLAALSHEAQEQLAARMATWVDARLEAAFAPLASAVPNYLDWYFSAPGSYQRLAVALVGDLDGWLDEQLHERLVAPSGVEAALAELQMDYPQRLAREQQALAAGLAATLRERYTPRQVAAEAAEAERSHLDLDAILLHALNDGLDRSRWSAAAVGGSGVGLVAGRALAGRLGTGAAVQGSRMALRSLALRLGAGAARSLASGGAAAVATSPTGPGALVTGTLTAAATLAGIAGSEYALLKGQEARHRPAMEAQLQEALAEARVALALALEAATDATTREMEARLIRAASPDEAREESPKAYRILGRRGD